MPLTVRDVAPKNGVFITTVSRSLHFFDGFPARIFISTVCKTLFSKSTLHRFGKEKEAFIMAYENETLGKLLSDPRIAPVASDAIRNRDISREPLWNKTLAQLKSEHFFSGEIGLGIQRLYRAAETGSWYFPLDEYDHTAEQTGTHVIWFPSDDPRADERPFIFLVPGGGFVNVWNLTEGWPIAEQYNRLGYHVFILTYQVNGRDRLLENNMLDFARALRFIRENEAHFYVHGDQYISCGFSAGGYLVCLWNTAMGYSAYHLPKPQAVFPVYPVTSLKLNHGEENKDASMGLYGCLRDEAAAKCYEIPEHAEGFPPCALFLAAGDELVNPQHSLLLAKALDRLHIPCLVEVGASGGHGFADGSGMCMAGWTGRAVQWYESMLRL